MFNQLVDSCAKCASGDVITDPAAGDIICRSCGEIQMSRIIDYSAEWHLYQDDDRPNKESGARSGKSDLVGLTLTNFTAVSDSRKEVLVRAQMMSTEKSELKVMHSISIVSDIASRLNLTRRIQVRTSLRLRNNLY
jgi:transcription initiation factor TFIIIB Brf1 subunit/transcription initiation factor TFIIB